MLDCRPRFLTRSDEELLDIFPAFEQWQNRQDDRDNSMNIILKRIFCDVDRLRCSDLRGRTELLNRLLDRDNGLQKIADAENGLYWVSADLHELLSRWRRGDLDPYILRGIETRKSLKDGRISRAEDRRFRFKREANKQGHNGLQIGQWWPLRLAMLRDGAHGSAEGGIAGNEYLGAVSCVIGGGASREIDHDYPDVDMGDRVLYCSTVHGNGLMTKHTKLMLRAYHNSNPVRLFRGAKLRSKYAPSTGIRYDGLYKIQSFEELDKKTKLYRFTMQREPGQCPIRYKGLEVRPTKSENRQWELCLTNQSKANPIQRAT